MRTAITVDLDDTLIMTQQDFSSAREWFGEYVSTNFGVSSERARSVQKDKSRELLDEYGLRIERFPNACVEALEQLVDSPRDSHKQRVYEIGRSSIKDTYQYRDRGFRSGAEELLNYCSQVADSLELLTAGDERLQNRKIEALELEQFFDEITISGIGAKESRLSELSNQYDLVVHIGNSSSSDVSAAVDAGVYCVYVPEGEWREGEIDRSNDLIKVAGNLNEATDKLAELIL